MKLSIVKGAQNVLVRIFIQDSSSTVGAGLTALTNSSTGLICYRSRDDDGNANGTQISLSAGTRGTWSSGGFVEKDSTNMPGIYEFGIPNNALVTGSRSVQIMLSGAANMAPVVLEIELTGWDNQDGVHGGLTSLPNTAITTNASLLTSGTGTDQLSVASGRIDVGKILGTASQGAAGYVGIDWAKVTNPTTTLGLTGTTISIVTTLTNLPAITSNWLTAAGIAAGALNGKGDWLISSSYPSNFSSFSIDTNGRCKIQSGLPKNVALSNFEFLLLDSSNNPVIGATVTATRSIDGVAFASCANSVTQVSNGVYKIDLAATDLNGNTITLRFVAAGAIDRFIFLITSA